LKECFQQSRTELATHGGWYYVERPVEALDEQGSLLDSVIRFTFDTVNVQHLDLRIVAETR
jgi:hypothetical protein